MHEPKSFLVIGNSRAASQLHVCRERTQNILRSMELGTPTHELVHLWNKFAFATRHIEICDFQEGNDLLERGNF
jgi:hypothetical protein